jgi:hypothetical protein
MTTPHQFSVWQKRLLAILGVVFLIAGAISVFVNTNGLRSIGLIAAGVFLVLLAKTGSFYSLRAGDWALHMADSDSVPAFDLAVEVVEQERSSRRRQTGTS